MLFIDGNQNDLASSGTKRASNISIIESEGSYTPRHKYNTRLSAKLSNTCELERNTEINSSAPYVSSSSLVSQQQVERIDQGDILDNPLCYKPTSLYDNKDSFLKTIKRNLRMDWSERCPRSSSSGDECSKLCVIGVIAGRLYMYKNTSYFYFKLLEDPHKDKMFGRSAVQGRC